MNRIATVIGIGIAGVIFFNLGPNMAPLGEKAPHKKVAVIPSIDDCEVNRIGNGTYFLCMQEPFNGRTFASEDEVFSAIEKVKNGTYEYGLTDEDRVLRDNAKKQVQEKCLPDVSCK